MEVIYYIGVFLRWLLNFVGDLTFAFTGIHLYRCSYKAVLNRLPADTREMVLKDPVLRKRLRMNCGYIESSPGSYPLFARLMMSMRMTNFLGENKQIQDILLKEPSIRKVDIVKPIFAIHLPRTGSNLLGRLMSCDDQFLAPKTWEMLEITSLKEREAPTSVFLEWLAPASKFGHMHTIGANQVDDGMLFLERRQLIINSMIYDPYQGEALWRETRENLRRDCESLKEQLQLIIAHRNLDMDGKRLFLKIHCNVFNVQALLDVFPDAQIVNGHRSPYELVPSVTSFTQAIDGIAIRPKENYYSAVQNNWFHARCGLQVIRQKHAIIEERRRNGLPTSDTFIDYGYQSLMDDPMGTLQKLYNDLGLPLRPEVKQEMTSWLENNKQDKHGRHVYSLEQFHLTKADVDEAWAEYQEYFKQYLR